MGMRVPFGQPFQSADAKIRVAFSYLHMTRGAVSVYVGGEALEGERTIKGRRSFQICIEPRRCA